MKAVAVVPGAHDSIHVRDEPDPQPGDNEALVRVLEAGVCGTDAEINEGLYGEAPPGSDHLILGHENLGVVEACPPGAGIGTGDLVVSTVRRPCPEACRPCASGQNDMCLTGDYAERGIKRLHGFMSERYAESARNLVRVPERLRRFAVLLEPLSIVEKGVEQAWKIQERLAWDPRVAVVLGAGPVGILAAALFRLRGLETHVISRDPRGTAREALLSDAGIRFASTAEQSIESVAAGLGPVDVVFEATGATAVVLAAMRMTGAGGVCVLSSVTPSGRPQEADLGAWNRETVLGNKVVLGTVNANRRHFEAGVRDLESAEHRLPGWMGRLVTRRLPFVDARQALERRPADIKTVLEFA